MLLALLQNTIANFESEKWKLSLDEIGWWAACGCGYQLPGVRVRVGGCADVCHVGGLTDNVHVLCFRCLRKKPLSRDLILIHMQFFFFLRKSTCNLIDLVKIKLKEITLFIKHFKIMGVKRKNENHTAH